jgi:hypothetical protein
VTSVALVVVAIARDPPDGDHPDGARLAAGGLPAAAMA